MGELPTPAHGPNLRQAVSRTPPPPDQARKPTAAPSGRSDQHRQNPNRLVPSSAGVAGRLLNLSLVAVVVEMHNVGALLDALQLLQFFVEDVASGADVV
jgi:hypothetical protein